MNSQHELMSVWGLCYYYLCQTLHAAVAPVLHYRARRARRHGYFVMENAHTIDTGDYIGGPRMAWFLCEKRGIRPELAQPDHRVCSIGWSEKDQRWYGWSHRAIHGFTIGDVVKEGDLTASSRWTDEYLAAHPEANKALPVGFEAKTWEDAKRMAIAFAEAVG